MHAFLHAIYGVRNVKSFPRLVSILLAAAIVVCSQGARSEPPAVTPPAPVAAPATPVSTPTPAPAPQPDPVSEQAKAVIVAPPTFQAGKPIALQAGGSVGAKFDWVISPAEQFVMIGDGRRQAVTWTESTQAFAVALTVTHTNGTTATAVHICNPAQPVVVQPPPTLPPPAIPPPETKPAPATPGMAVTYVYKSRTPVPGEVLAGLNRINREKGIRATLCDDDPQDGTNDIPDQYKLAVAAAREKGLPSLVIVAEGKVVKVVPDPKTEAEVWGAVQ